MKRIKTYEDLRQERLRLESTLIIQKEALRNETEDLKELFKPFSVVSRWLGGLQKSIGQHPITAAGVSTGVDLLLRDNLLSKSNWLIRTIIPFTVKSILSLFSKRKSPSKSSDQTIQHSIKE